MNTFAHNIAPGGSPARNAATQAEIVAQELQNLMRATPAATIAKLGFERLVKLHAEIKGLTKPAATPGAQPTNNEFRDYSINALMEASAKEGSLTRRFADAIGESE
jgi:hypothetical protein